MQASEIKKLTFSGHETFPFRFAWLSKAVSAVTEDSEIFGAEDAMVRLGVGKNMVKSMRHWALATRVIEDAATDKRSRGRSFRPTKLGTQLFGPRGWDPYFEDPMTPWLLHWNLASNPEKAATWFYAFNLMPKAEFTKTELLHWIQVWIEASSSRATAASLKRDIDCFVRTYVRAKPTRTQPLEDTLECPLADLGLVREFGGRGSYLMVRGERTSLPDELVAYALLEFLGATEREAKTIAMDEIAFATGSPGRVFALSEDALLHRFDQLSRVTSGALSFDETAGLRQVIINDAIEPMNLLRAYYAKAAKGGKVNAA